MSLTHQFESKWRGLIEQAKQYLIEKNENELIKITLIQAYILYIKVFLNDMTLKIVYKPRLFLSTSNSCKKGFDKSIHPIIKPWIKLV